MKVIVAVAVLLTVFALLLPFVSAYERSDAPLEPDPASPGESPDPQDEPAPFYQGISSSQDSDFLNGADREQTVLLLDGETVRATPMDEYLFGALGAEMPASFEPEALKAQTVAIRSYLYYKARAGSSRHPDAHICSDSTCCAAWRSGEALREKWGADYGLYAEKIRRAVAETDGLVLTYGGQAALAVFHSSSAGQTETCLEVWAKDLPYLVSVPSPEDASQVPNYVSGVTVSAEDFRETVLASFPEADFSGEPSGWLGPVERSGSGRVHTAELGGVTVTGKELRSMFGLRSTAVELTTDGESFTMTVTGYGHGVGMSQYGANVMALEGADFRDILANYYPGTELIAASELAN